MGHVQRHDTCIPHAQRDPFVHDGCMRSEGVVSFRGLSPICIYIYIPNMSLRAWHDPCAWCMRTHGLMCNVMTHASHMPRGITPCMMDARGVRGWWVLGDRHPSVSTSIYPQYVPTCMAWSMCMMHEDTWAHVQCHDTCIPHAQRDHSMHDGCTRSEGVVSFRGSSPICIYIYIPPICPYVHGMIHVHDAWGHMGSCAMSWHMHPTCPEGSLHAWWMHEEWGGGEF